MNEPLNSDPEIQQEIDRTIAAMRAAEKNILQHIASLRDRRPETMEEEMGRDIHIAYVRAEWRRIREPYVHRVQKLASSSRQNGVTYLEPMTQELAGRVGQAVA